MADKTDMIYDLLQNFSSESKDRMGRIEEDLREHKEGVIQNRTRIRKLEEPGNALGLVKKWALWFTAVSGAVYALYKLMELS